MGKNASQIQCFANISDWELVESTDAKFTNTVDGCIHYYSSWLHLQKKKREN